MAKRYKAVLFAPDGDWVTYWEDSETIEEVQEKLANQGSTWFFYPFHAVIRDHQNGITKATQRLVDVAEPFEDWKGVSIKRFSQLIQSYSEEELRSLIS